MSSGISHAGEGMAEMEGIGQREELVSRRNTYMLDDFEGETHLQKRLELRRCRGGDHTLETVSLCFVSLAFYFNMSERSKTDLGKSLGFFVPPSPNGHIE